jgi:hypothetical protein
VLPGMKYSGPGGLAKKVDLISPRRGCTRKLVFEYRYRARELPDFIPASYALATWPKRG